MPFSVPPLCLWPERLRGKSWNRIPMEELACQPIVKAVDVLVQVHAGQSATLSCQVTGSFITHKRKSYLFGCLFLSLMLNFHHYVGFLFTIVFRMHISVDC